MVLILIPDDLSLLPQLHLGKSHSLNGSNRHASSRNNEQLAIQMSPSLKAFSTLEKPLFYLKDYEGTLEGFD